MPILVDGTIVAPPAPPPPVFVEVALARQGMRNVWTGWDESVWDLTDSAGGTLLGQGVNGMAMPPIENYRSEAPGISGSQWRGNRVQNRSVLWPMYVYSDGLNTDWMALDRAFWSTMRPTRTGTWSVIHPDGTIRSIDLRYESGDDGFMLDPFFTGWALYGITLTAEQPFWREDPIRRRFTAGQPLEFFGPPGIVNITNGSQLGTASINNPGDVLTSVTWTIAGPCDSAVVGAAGKTIEVPFALGVGEFLSIYTQSDEQIAIDGVQQDRTDELGHVDFSGSQIAPGDEHALSLQLINAGDGAYIEAALTPYFYRAW